ncbi:hypothetical protein AgCh_036387 [Apium graveolens]
MIRGYDGRHLAKPKKTYYKNLPSKSLPGTAENVCAGVVVQPVFGLDSRDCGVHQTPPSHIAVGAGTFDGSVGYVTNGVCAKVVVPPVFMLDSRDSEVTQTHSSRFTVAAGTSSSGAASVKYATLPTVQSSVMSHNVQFRSKRKQIYSSPGVSRQLFTAVAMDVGLSSNDFGDDCPTVLVPPLFSSDSDDSDYSGTVGDAFDGGDDDDHCMRSNLLADVQFISERKRDRRVVPEVYAILGSPDVICSSCNARMWREERANKNVTKGIPLFSLCCMKGSIKLPPVPPTPPYLMELYTHPQNAANFHRMIRMYNCMFCFTSTDGNIDNFINRGGAPYIYRLNGQNHHVFGSLIPIDNKTPKFCQLYIYDTVNEVDNRLRWLRLEDQYTVNQEVVQGLIAMLDETNELVQKFRQQRDRWESEEICELEVTLKVSRSESGRENHVVPSDEVAGIMVGDDDNTCGFRDIIMDDKVQGLVRASYVHPKLMSLKYPILFPWGEDGFHPRIKFHKTANNSSGSRGYLSMKDYYCYSFQVREYEGMTPRLGGRLFQQYIVDAYSSVEQTRLWWFRTNQTILCNELYSHICVSV